MLMALRCVQTAVQALGRMSLGSGLYDYSSHGWFATPSYQPSRSGVYFDENVGRYRDSRGRFTKGPRR